MAHSSASSIILLCPGLSLPALLPWISPPCTWREQGTQTIPQLVFPLIIALLIKSVVPVTREKSSCSEVHACHSGAGWWINFHNFYCVYSSFKWEDSVSENTYFHWILSLRTFQSSQSKVKFTSQGSPPIVSCLPPHIALFFTLLLVKAFSAKEGLTTMVF